MRRIAIGFLVFMWAYALATAQSVLVEPFLQNVSQNDAAVVWETDALKQSIVYYGTTASLGDSTTGEAISSNNGAYIHQVYLDGLTSATRYYYKVRTGTYESDTLHFTTMHEATVEQDFRMIAMSDMQHDGSNPTVFNEIVHNGIIPYVDSLYGPEIDEEIGMVIIPGDLVSTGSNWSHWRNYFFDQSAPLFGYVPVYPVPGNHEGNASQFFDYFILPENGTPGYEEHWWSKDYSNVRVLGMDSNNGYRIQAQLDWLDAILAESCTDTLIDFVFVQLHHPHKSELWLPGETGYVGQIIERLESFSSDCSKPSIHFFGHTHGYSRGQSQDHEHLWVNVATAGGNIDYWGEYAQADYDEFVISQDEYGFVIVEVTAGDEPAFTLKRISIGDEFTSKDNTLEDEISIRANNTAPVQPYALFPRIVDTVSPSCVVIAADAFQDADEDFHQGAQWQLAFDSSGFDNPVIDEWRQHKNWYFDINTQAGDDLTDLELSDLLSDTTYWWRVRYRDGGLVWSDWSDPVKFRTGTSGFSPNLVSNPGAEDGVSDWIVTIGALESLSAGECAGGTPYAGTKYFGVGALCEEHPFASAYQDIDASDWSDIIDNSVANISFGAYLADWNGNDQPAIALQFYDSLGALIGASDTLSAQQSTWILKQATVALPAATRTLRFIIMGTRYSGADNDSYIDEIFCRVGAEDSTGCSVYSPLGPQFDRIYVDGGAIAVPDGKSWTTAYRSLQQALLDTSYTKPEIWIAEGTYAATNDGDRSASNNITRAVKVYGGFAGNETLFGDRNPTEHPVIITGDIGVVSDTTDNTRQIFKISQSIDSVLIDGLKIQYGNADTTSQASGAGIYIDSSMSGHVTISNCSVTNHHGLWGAAIANYSPATVHILNSSFEDNRAYYEGNSIINVGGLLVLENVTLITTCPDCGIEVQNIGGGEIRNEGSVEVIRE